MCRDVFPLTEESVAKTKSVENQNNGNFLQVLCSDKLVASGSEFLFVKNLDLQTLPKTPIARHSLRTFAFFFKSVPTDEENVPTRVISIFVFNFLEELFLLFFFSFLI